MSTHTAADAPQSSVSTAPALSPNSTDSPSATSASQEWQEAPQALRPLHSPIQGIHSAALIGAGAHVCGIALTVTAGWLIVRASEQPPILMLLCAIVGVRAFGLARPLLRYWERLSSHRAALSFLAYERARVYRRLIPLTPARLGQKARGTLLSHVVDDLDDIAYAHIRVVVPVAAVFLAGLFCAALSAIVSWVAAALILSFVALSALVAWVTYMLERASHHRLVTARAGVATLTSTLATERTALLGIGAAPALLQRLEAQQRHLSVAYRAGARARIFALVALPVLTAAHTIALIAFLAPAVNQGLPAPLVALLVLAPVALGDVVAGLPDAVTALARAHSSQERLADVLHQEPAVQDPGISPATEHPEQGLDPVGEAEHEAAEPLLTAHTGAPTEDTHPPENSSENTPIRTVVVSVPSLDEQLFGSASADPVIDVLEAPAEAIEKDRAGEAHAATCDGSAEKTPHPDGEPPATTPERPEAHRHTGADHASASPGSSLTLTDIAARWRPDGPEALPPTSLQLKPGEFVGIVGPNGVGKSTLLAVVARHLDPHQGTYLLNNEDALSRPLATVRSRIAVVDDEPHVFATTVRENIRFAAPGCSDTRIVRALRLAGLSSWLGGLPHGLDTLLGMGYRSLSGGERARLSVARALASERPLMVLDEPVAHLDHDTARAVLGDVREASHGRTVVIVSHRPVGIELADRVLELTHASSEVAYGAYSPPPHRQGGAKTSRRGTVGPHGEDDQNADSSDTHVEVKADQPPTSELAAPASAAADNHQPSQG